MNNWILIESRETVFPGASLDQIINEMVGGRRDIVVIPDTTIAAKKGFIDINGVAVQEKVVIEKWKYLNSSIMIVIVHQKDEQ